MKRSILLLIVLYPLFGFSQTAEDSLLAQLKHINVLDHDSIYSELYYMHLDSDPEKSVKYAYKHLEHSLKYGDLEKQVTSYRILGTSLIYNNEYDNAERNLKIAYKVADSLNFNNELTKICAQLAALYFHLDKYKKSVELYLQFIDLSKYSENSQFIASGYNNLGLIYYRIGDYKTALKFYLMCIETTKKYNLSKGILYYYNNIGLCYIGIHKYYEAINYFNRIIENCNNCNEKNLIDAYYGLGKSYLFMNRNKDALIYLNKSSDMSIRNSEFISYANSNSLISEIYIKQNDNENALKHLNKIKELDFNFPSSIEFKIMLLYSNIYENKGDFQKALEFKNKYILLKDSIFSDKNVSEIKNLLIDYQLSENEQVIKDKEIQIQRNRQFVYMFGILLILLSIVLLFAYRNLKIRKKLNEKLSSLVYQRTQELNSFIYRTSHDLAGPVATIKGLLGLMTIDNYKNEVEDFIKRMDMTNKRLQEIILKLNTVSKINSKTIDPENIDIESLIFEIINDVKNGTDNLIDIQLHGNRMFRTDRTLVYIIFYNILLNSFQHIDHREIKHEVKVDINNNGNLVVRISDNGKGIETKYSQKIFDLFYVANDKSDGNGLGLYQARLAAQRLKGNIKLLQHKKPIIFEISIQKAKKKLVYLSQKNAIKT